MTLSAGLPTGWLQARETRVLLAGQAGAIEVVINGVPKVRAVALLCHPHPLYGGNLDNKVVSTLARACRDNGVVAVRFNFRGVGCSEGVHDDGVGELLDAHSVLETLRRAQPDLPVVLGGFSFGAAIAAQLARSVSCAGLLLVAPPVPRYGLDAIACISAPVLLMQAEDDEVVDSLVVFQWFGRLSAPQKVVKRWSEAGHFFHGQMPGLKLAAQNFLYALPSLLSRYHKELSMKRNLSEFSRAQLAQLAREYMLASQFNSRTGYAALRMKHGDEAYKEIAIINWMAVSPIYTQRMQKAMAFTGTDVATIFKGLQLDCGLTHQYFDAHFEVFSADKGRFWLASCGPLLETEPRGDDAVKVMCHDIEDPTFDATAIATNPRARMRPVHRPPRVPVDRVPHCEWNVFIDHDAEPLLEPEITSAMRNTLLANLQIVRAASTEPGGMDDYSGAVFEQLHFEQLSHAALVVVCKEIAIQNHFLILGLMVAMAGKYGEDAARAAGEFQMTGSGWVMSHRLKKWFGHEGGGIDAIVDVLSVHPAFQPVEYHAIEISKTGPNTATFRLLDCAALQEKDAFALGWVTLLRQGKTAGLDAIVKGVDPRAHIVSRDGMEWDIVVDESAAIGDEPLAVQIAKGTVLYQTKLEDRVSLLQL
jgi:alpha/beta superfamily hydrolase